MSAKNKAELRIYIRCGESTCASEPGKFCGYLGVRKFGREWVCMLFPSDQPYTRLHDKDGWIQRCDACVEATTWGVGGLEKRRRSAGPLKTAQKSDNQT